MHRPVSATLVVLMHSTLLWASCSAKVDALLNEDEFGGDRYPNGTVLVMRIERDGVPLQFTVTVRPICQERV